MSELTFRDQSIITQVAAKIAADLTIASLRSVDPSIEDYVETFGQTLTTVKDQIIAEHGVTAVQQAFPGSTVQQEPQAYVPQQAPQQSYTNVPPAIPGVQDGDPATAALWNEFFNDPSKFYDNRRNKKNPKGPDFKHRDDGDKALWVVGKKNPSWVAARLAQAGL